MDTAPPEPTAAMLSIDDVAAFGDAELADFMKKNRRADGDYELPVDGWDTLSKDERAQLAERLKAQERAIAQSPAACSRPVDLDELDARLRDISQGNDVLSRGRPWTIERLRPPTPPVDEEAMARDGETEAYHNLVNDGGRPLYPIDLLEQVLKNPGQHGAMLRSWQNPCDPTSWKVFRRQLQRWQDFRKWQIDNRDFEDNDGGFPAYVDMMKRLYAKDEYTEGLAEIEANPSCLKSAWELKQGERQRQRYFCREHGCDGFPDYVEAVKRRLARHNFTRPFQLKTDPSQQDKLTTWIEYLNFEYWWFDRYSRTIERLKPGYDKAWQALVDSGVLRPHETKESIRTVASAMQGEAEKDQAWEAEQRAKLEAENVYTLTQQDPQRLRIPQSRRLSMLQAATAKLGAAKDRLQSIKRRCHLITHFIRGAFDYEDAKKHAARHTILLRWILAQVPLIEAEVIQSGATEASPAETKRIKRRFTANEEPVGKRSSKKQKLEHRELSSCSSSSTAILADAAKPRTERHFTIHQVEARTARSQTPQAGRVLRSAGASKTMSQGPSRGLRRSARIAARRNASAMALTPQTGRPESCLKSHAKPEEPPGPLEDTKPMSTKRALKNGGRWGSSKPKGVSKRDRRPRPRRG